MKLLYVFKPNRNFFGTKSYNSSDFRNIKRSKCEKNSQNKMRKLAVNIYVQKELTSGAILSKIYFLVHIKKSNFLHAI